MKTIRINIQKGNDRENMIIALANAGINVKIETEQNPDTYTGNLYWVCFELPEKNVKP